MAPVVRVCVVKLISKKLVRKNSKSEAHSSIVQKEAKNPKNRKRVQVPPNTKESKAFKRKRERREERPRANLDVSHLKATKALPLLVLL